MLVDVVAIPASAVVPANAGLHCCVTNAFTLAPVVEKDITGYYRSRGVGAVLRRGRTGPPGRLSFIAATRAVSPEECPEISGS